MLADPAYVCVCPYVQSHVRAPYICKGQSKCTRRGRVTLTRLAPSGKSSGSLFPLAAALFTTLSSLNLYS